MIKADVLPSYQKDTVIKMQVVGFPTSLEILEGGEADNKGILAKKNLAGRDGFIYPTILRRNVGESGYFDTSNITETNIVKSRIKSIHYGLFEFSGEEHVSFIVLRVNTQFGDLDLAVSYDTIETVGKEKIVEDAEVFSEVVLSGDVSIYDYEFGLIRDVEHDLMAVAYALTNGNAERLKNILARTCEYTSAVSGKNEYGFQRIIAIINRMANSLRGSLRTYIAETILPGKKRKGLVLEYEDGDRSLAFLEYESDNKIKSIRIEYEDAFEYKIVGEQRSV